MANEMETIVNESYWPEPKEDEMLIATVGGVGEIGMNFTMYGHNGEWIIVDAGVGFLSNEEKKATGVTGKTVAFDTIHDIAPKIKALVVTHGHADHIEGIAPLMENLNIPVYASPFACCLIKERAPDADIREFVPGEEFDIDGFNILTISTTHSIPESVHLMITGDGMTKGVLHTGDWKIDLTNKNSQMDLKTLDDLGANKKIGCLVGDSTNARRDGKTPDESAVIPAFEHIMENAKGSVYVCCFASNVDRIDNVINTAVSAGRVVAASGRSMLKNIEIATDLGYANGDVLVPANTLHTYDPSVRTLIMTGSQGEENAILSRLINQGVDSDKMTIPQPRSGDTLVMSSRTIPGNEQVVNELLDRYRALGVKVITSDGPDLNTPSNSPLWKHPVHVSGHPSRDDLRSFLLLTAPDNVVPVHGKENDMEAHAELAREAGAKSLIPRVGSVISMKDSGPVQEIAVVPVFQDEHTEHVRRHGKSRGMNYGRLSRKQPQFT